MKLFNEEFKLLDEAELREACEINTMLTLMREFGCLIDRKYYQDIITAIGEVIANTQDNGTSTKDVLFTLLSKYMFPKEQKH